MLQIIDQSNPLQCIYRCDLCGEEGISNVERSGAFLPATTTPAAYFWSPIAGRPAGQWRQHICRPQQPRPVAPAPEPEKPKRKYTRRAKVDTPAT